MKAAIESGAAYVDIEFEADEEIKEDLLKNARMNNCKVIISYHNFYDTPAKEELHKIIDRCFTEGADVVKIATTALSEADSSRILGLYEHYTSLVALAMGEKGRITRIANLLLGSPFTFASVSDSGKTAQGQFTVKEMKDILKYMKS